MINIDEILKASISAHASDVHIVVGMPPLFRIHTVVTPTDFPTVTQEYAQAVLLGLVGAKRADEFAVNKDIDFSHEIRGVGRFRVNAHWQRGTVGLAFRTIYDKIRSLDQLYLPEIIHKLTDRKSVV
jgi:twitching motility protein PilT